MLSIVKSFLLFLGIIACFFLSFFAAISLERGTSFTHVALPILLFVFATTAMRHLILAHGVKKEKVIEGYYITAAVIAGLVLSQTAIGETLTRFPKKVDRLSHISLLIFPIILVLQTWLYAIITAKKSKTDENP